MRYGLASSDPLVDGGGFALRGSTKLLEQEDLAGLIDTAHHCGIAGGLIRRHQQAVGFFDGGIVIQQRPHPFNEFGVQVECEEDAT